VIAIGWLFGDPAPVDVVSATNPQVAGRVNPGIVDLVAALATGAVGAFALSRSDVSDTLPGVAIAISLVPPLAVVGLTLEAGESDESWGALLLFLTNVGAILFSGLIVMTIFRVFEIATPGSDVGLHRGYRGVQVAVIVSLAALTVPLGASTYQLTSERLKTGNVQNVAEEWARPSGWRISEVNVEPEGINVRAYGPLPEPDADGLRSMLDTEGLESVDVRLELVPETRIDLPGN
jgi:uncharacterized membrane protein